MKAYKWELPGFPILLECNKEDAIKIIRHFGIIAKGSTLLVDGEKVSFYGVNEMEKVIAPIKELSLIVPGHEIPEIGPEITLAIFLDDYKMVNWFEFFKFMQHAEQLFIEMKNLSELESINDYEKKYKENPRILDDLFSYLLIFFEPKNINFYPSLCKGDNSKTIPLYLPHNTDEIHSYCGKNLYCMLHACYYEAICKPLPDNSDAIDSMTLNECLNHMMYWNRRGINCDDWKSGKSKRIIQRIIELRNNSL